MVLVGWARPTGSTAGRDASGWAVPTLRLQLALPGGSVRPVPPGDARNGVLAVAEAPPHVRLSVRPDPQRRKPRRPTSLRRHVAIRHITGHRVVALIVVTSPANKDRKTHVRELAEKVVLTLESGVHVLLLDLLPAG